MTTALVKDDVKQGNYRVNFREIIDLKEWEARENRFSVCTLKIDLADSLGKRSQMLVTLDFSDVESLLPAIGAQYEKWRTRREAGKDD